MQFARSISTTSTRLRGSAAVFFAALMLGAQAFASHASASVRVHRPDSGDYVVMRFGSSGGAQLASLKSAVDGNPQDAATLLRYVDALMSIAARTGNERFNGFAERALDSAPASIRDSLAVKHAHLLQSRHDFVGAETLLTAFLKGNPRQRDALLMRAQVRIHLQNSNDALRDCATLIPLSDLLTSTTCIAQARGALGDLERAYGLVATLLQNANSNASSADSSQHATLGWSANVAAELAARLGRNDVATRWYRVAYELDPHNHFARLSYIDWLLALGQTAQAQAVARAGITPADRLRYVLASGDDRSIEARQLLLAWQEADRRGERDHLRDRARFELLVHKDTARAHATARDNFRDHRTPDDALLLAATAARTRDAIALVELRTWRDERKYRDVRIDSVLDGRS